MSALARTTESDCYTRAANEDCVNGGPRTRTKYVYDGKTRLSTQTITIPGDAAYTYTWTYNATTGLLDTLQYPVSTSGYQLKLQYAYQNGILQQISDVATGTHYWTANTLNPQGQLTQETLGNSVVVNHAWDAVTGWVNSIQAGVGGGSALQNNSYLFDEVGNLTQRQDNNQGLTENVYYDNLYRLDHTVGDTNTQMTYDAMGRIATWAAYGTTVNVRDYTTPQTGCTYYANSQLHATRSNTQGSSVASYCYDANGNMTKSTYVNTQSVIWTSFNQPSSITGGPSSSQFFYNQDHQRYKQIASYSGSSETTYYVGGLLEKMINPSGTAYRHYIPAGSNTVVYTRVDTGTNLTYYLTKDHLGSTAVITDSTGAPLLTGKSEKFSALGWNENSSADEATMATVTRHEFTGHEGLDNVGIGMVNMDGRIYMPSGSMFLSPDPNIPDPSNTQSYNRYSYVRNNPLTLVDPTGYWEQSAAVLEDGGGYDSSGSSETVPGIFVYGDRSYEAMQSSELQSLINSLQQKYAPSLNQLSLDPVTVVAHKGKTSTPAFVPATVIAWQLMAQSQQSQQTQCTFSDSWTNYLPRGVGGSVGYNLAAGVSSSWSAAKTGTWLGGGQFFSANTGPNQGTYTTNPGPISSSSAFLASASAGASFFLTNAQSVQQLSGPFTTDSLDVGVGPFQFGAQLSYGGGIWELSFSPPFGGLTLGLSISQTITDTTVKSQSTNGCH